MTGTNDPEPPGSRRRIAERDALTGPPPAQQSHLLSRTALLRSLLAEPLIRDRFELIAQRVSGIAAVRARIVAQADALARTRGLASHTALFDPAAPVDETLRAEVRAQWAAYLDDATIRGRDFADEMRRLTVELVAALQLPTVCTRWLGFELVTWFFLFQEASLTGQPVTVRYDVKATNTPTIQMRDDPAMSNREFARRAVAERRRVQQEAQSRTRSRMPWHHGADIKKWVEWLVRHRLHGIPLRRLAREDAADAARKHGTEHGAHHRKVQYGIQQVTHWLAEVPLRGPDTTAPQQRKASKAGSATSRRSGGRQSRQVTNVRAAAKGMPRARSKRKRSR